MAGFFQNMFTGNPNKPEFTSEMLPKNRFELFWEMLKLNFFNLLKANLFYLIFTIPMWIWIWLNSQLLTGMLAESAQSASIQAILPFFNEGYFIVFLAGMIPCLILQGPAKMALKHVTRNWARDDYANAWSDFWYAFKSNWKQGLLLGLLNGLLFSFAIFGFYFYTVMPDHASLYAVMQIVLVMLCIVYAFMNLYMWPMLVTYDMRFMDVLRNSMIIALGRLPFSLIFVLITLVPAVVCVFFPIAIIYYFLFGYAFHAFINVSYTNGAFDKYINSRIEGMTVNKGLRPAQEDEYEYVDIDDEDEEDGKK